jgi:nucleotide-binding universal stress UspA family protein
VTFSFSRILLATEHTEFDAGAERLAFELAKQYAAPLLGVLPMVSNDVYETVAPELVAQAEEAAFAKLTQLRAAAGDAGVDLDIRVRRGEDPAQEIVAEAQRCAADLVVARRRGKRGFFAKQMVGEMVGKVAALAPCSVLLVPRAGQPWSQRVLAGVDASVAAQRAAEVAAGIALGGNLPLLIASSAAHDTAADRAHAEAAVASALAIARRVGARAEGRIVAGRPDGAIAKLAAESGADLLVVGRTGESGRLQRLLLGGTAHRIVGLASCPVLVVKP